MVSPIAISDVQNGALGTRRATGRKETDEALFVACSRSLLRVCALVHVYVCDEQACGSAIVMSITNEDSCRGGLSLCTSHSDSGTRLKPRPQDPREAAINSPLGCLGRFLPSLTVANVASPRSRA